MARPVIVTRPAAAGQRLAGRLRQRGHEVVWWPAFDIAPPADEDAVRLALAQLDAFDLALFVSPNAVQAVAERLPADWPAGTLIGAVGTATRDAALLRLPGARADQVIAPEADETSGSESFWRAWQASGRTAGRVLLLRAATGREWLAEHFRDAGAHVEALPVYERRVRELGADDRQRLARWVGAVDGPIAVVSSTEAVDAVLAQAGAVDGAPAWLKQGIALATHPRVAERLADAGFVHVETCAADDPAVIGKLESISG